VRIVHPFSHKLYTHVHRNSPEPKPSDDSAATEAPLVSQTLLAPLTLLSTHLAYLVSSLSQTSFTTLYRRISANLAEYILNRQILFRGTFDSAECRTILAECELFVETCHSALASGGGLPGGRARVETPWGKLLQAGRLVGLEGDVWDKVVDATFGTYSQEDWEGVVRDATGYSELSRDAVGDILCRRDDSLA
jgi:hypothetical protein